MTMTVSSQDLIDHFGADRLNVSTLSRWRQRGWLHFTQEMPGSGHYVEYPDWTPKMVDLLLRSSEGQQRGDSSHHKRLRGLFASIANTLAERPDTEWMAVVGRYMVRTVDSAEDAILHAYASGERPYLVIVLAGGDSFD